MPQVKQFKTTCQGCGNVTFRPYVDFDALISKEKDPKQQAKNTVGNALIIGGSTAACLPLGCCMMGDSINQKRSKGKPKEWRIKNYCKAFTCKKCRNTVLITEVVTNDVE